MAWKTRNLAIRGVAISWIAHFALLASSFFLTPVIVRSLGKEKYGMWSIIMALSSYFGLASFGLGNAITKYIAQFDAQNDRRQVDRVFATSCVINLVWAVGVFAISGIIAWYFPSIFEVGTLSVGEIRWAVILTGLMVSFEFLGQSYPATLFARKRFDLANGILALSHLLSTSVVVLIAFLGANFVAMSFAQVVVIATTQVLFVVVATQWGGVGRSSLRDVRFETCRILFTFGSLNAFTQLARRLSMYAGGITVGFFLGPVSVAYYSIGEQLVQKCMAICKSINQIVMPIGSQFDAEQDKESLSKLIIMTARLLLALAFFFGTVFGVLGKSFLSHWLTPEYAAESYPILCILTLSLVVKLPSSGIQAVLSGMNRMGFLSRTAASEGISLMLLGFLLVPKFGTVGMAWASCIAGIFNTGLLVPLYACREISLPFGSFFYRVLLPAAASILPGLCLAVLLFTTFPAASLLVDVVQIALVGVASIIGIYFFSLNHEMRSEAIRIVLGWLSVSHRTYSVDRKLPHPNTSASDS